MNEPSRRSRRFFVAFTLVVAGLVFAGFTLTFFLPLARRTFHVPWFVYVHGGLFFVWIGLLFLQAVLAARGRIDLHRRFGLVGWGLIPLMLVTGAYVAYWASIRDLHFGRGDPVITKYFGELMDVALFAILATLALTLRRNTQVHKRLMLLATIALSGAAVGRIPVVAGYVAAVSFGLVLVIAAYDLHVFKRVHLATAAGGAFLLLGIFAETPIGETPQWLALGRRILIGY